MRSTQPSSVGTPGTVKKPFGSNKELQVAYIYVSESGLHNF